MKDVFAHSKHADERVLRDLAFDQVEQFEEVDQGSSYALSTLFLFLQLQTRASSNVDPRGHESTRSCAHTVLAVAEAIAD